MQKEKELWAQRIFQAEKSTLYGIIMMDTCYYTFFQTYRMYSTKSELYSKLWALGDYDVSV